MKTTMKKSNLMLVAKTNSYLYISVLSKVFYFKLIPINGMPSAFLCAFIPL